MTFVFEVSRLSGRQGSTESMVSSYHGNTVTEQLSQNTNIANPGSNVLMTTSLIENIKNMETTVQPEMAENSKLTISNQSSQETNTNNGEFAIIINKLYLTLIA